MFAPQAVAVVGAGTAYPVDKLRLAALFTLAAAAGWGTPAVVLTVEIVADVTGCGSIDPTDPQNYSAVKHPQRHPRPGRRRRLQRRLLHVPLPMRLSAGQWFTDSAACGAAERT